MLRQRLFLLAILLGGLSVMSAPAVSLLATAAAAQTLPAGPPLSSAPLLPLPARCGGSLPPGQGVPACCVSGYVFVDGQPVAGAKVTISSASGSAEFWTERRPNHPLPYYRASLSGSPLLIQPGEPLTITATYRQFTQTLTHATLPGGQQVDVVLQRASAGDYVLDNSIYWQGRSGYLNSAVDIVADPSDTIYVLDADNYLVQVFSPQGEFLRSWGSFGQAPGQFLAPVAIAADHAGHIYVSDIGQQRIHKFSNTGAWLASWGGPGSGPGQFYDPQGLAISLQGEVYVADQRNGRVQVFDSNGRWLRSWRDFGSAGEQLYFPVDVSLDDQGLVYVLSYQGLHIFSIQGVWQRDHLMPNVGWELASVELSSDGFIYVALNSTGVYKLDASFQRVAQITNDPTDPKRALLAKGLTLDSQGRLYVADNFEHKVLLFSQQEQLITSWGNLLDNQFYKLDPRASVVDSANNVYILDARRDALLKYSSDGAYLALLGAFPADSMGGNSLAIDRYDHIYLIAGREIYKIDQQGRELARLTLYPPYQTWSQGSLAISSSGMLFVPDGYNGLVHVFDQQGNWLRSWKPAGAIPWNGNFGNLVIDADDNIYLVYNHGISKLSPLGVLLERWDNLGSDPEDFLSPNSITLDTTGAIYVSDYVGYISDYRIQRRDPNGTWSIIIDQTDRISLNGLRVSSIDRNGNLLLIGAGALYKFTRDGSWLETWGGTMPIYPIVPPSPGIASNSRGEIYVVDIDFHRVLKFDKDGRFLASLGSQGSGPGLFNYPLDVAVDRHDQVYVTDIMNHRVQQFSPDGLWQRSWGMPGLFGSIAGIAVSPDGILYVVDAGQGGVYQIDTVAPVASQGVQQADQGQPAIMPFIPALDRQGGSPVDIVVDLQGNTYLLDTDSGEISRYGPAGSLSWSWFAAGEHAGSIGFPTSIAVDLQGNVYVSGAILRQFSPEGVLLRSWAEDELLGYGDAGLRGLALSAGIDGSILVSSLETQHIMTLHPMIYTKPIATVLATSERTLVQGQPITLYGGGSDSDETNEIVSYSWQLDGQPLPFSTAVSATLSTAGLAPGRHTVSLTVEDDEGERSNPQSISIEVLPPAEQPEQTWTMLLVFDADTAPGTLAPYLSRTSPTGALYRLEHLVSNPYVPVVALYDGPEIMDSARLVFWPDGRIDEEPLGEVDLSSAQTLVDFVRWGQQQAPANHYYLSLVDHASALEGMLWDSSSGANARLTHEELRTALVTLTDNGALPIDVLQLDVCLLGTLENVYQLRSMARYLVVSENLAWSAFAYESYRAAIGSRTSPEQLARAVVERYAQRIASTQESEAPLPFTIAALDMSALDPVAAAVDRLAVEGRRYALLGPAQRQVLRTLRAQVQVLDTDANFVLNAQDEHIDLTHWAQLLASGVEDDGVRQAAAELLVALQGLIVAEQHSSGVYFVHRTNLDQAHGLAIYYPSQPGVGSYRRYLEESGLIFPRETGWDEFLAVALPHDTLVEPGSGPTGPLTPLPVRDRVYLPFARG